MTCCAILNFSTTPLPVLSKESSPNLSQKIKICAQKSSCVTQNPLITVDRDDQRNMSRVYGLITAASIGTYSGLRLFSNMTGHAFGGAVFGVTCGSMILGWGLCRKYYDVNACCVNNCPTHALVARVANFI